VSSAGAGDTSQIGLRVSNCLVRSTAVKGFYSIFKRGLKGVYQHYLSGRFTEKSSQLRKFKGAAREVRTDDSEERFDRMLKRVAGTPPAEKPKSAK
jgi:hypothetical protein